MDQSDYLELWNAYEPSKVAFSELDSTWARQGHARVTCPCAITSGCVRACQIDTPCGLPV
ncbi:S-adenosylmethionine synthase [Gossypium arboreum]|uniref:S-adenosylmethionine synthase n=1 Tax=Gossypium arboreum TaxID=29729 RepID=A0A0B0NC69_GOSAR|nr:S-adenosylmethionine synthase [Gossypium arboreum]